jgi:hypothetical protein
MLPQIPASFVLQALVLCLAYNFMGTIALLIGVGGDNLSSLLWAGEHLAWQALRGLPSSCTIAH